MAVTKRELASSFGRQAGLSRDRSVHITRLFVELLHEALVTRGKVRLPGFGSLRVVTRQAHQAFDPSTGQRVQLPDRKRVVFRPGQELRRRLNG